MEPAMKLLISSLVLGFLSITCYGVSFGTNVWWVIKTGGIKTTQGLWKACVEYNGATQCKNREDFLSFKEKKGYDPIVICLLLSAGFTVFTMIFGLSILCCCKNSAKIWQKTIRWMTFFAIISFVAGVDAMLYTEFEFREVLANNTRGWSYMVAWAGTFLQLIVLFLILIQLCVKPRDTSLMSAWS